MRAKKLFTPTADLTNSRRYIAALISLQTKAPVHYSVLLATEVIWTDAVGTAATDGIYVYISPDFFAVWRQTHSGRSCLLMRCHT